MNTYKIAWWVLLILGAIKLVGAMANFALFPETWNSTLAWNITNYSILIVGYASIIGVVLLIYFIFKKSVAGILNSLLFVILSVPVYAFLSLYLNTDYFIDGIVNFVGSIIIVGYSIAILRKRA